MKFFRRRYKVDEWSKYFSPGHYFSAYTRPWWWPFWRRIVGGTDGMCLSIERAEEQIEKYRKNPLPKYIGE